MGIFNRQGTPFWETPPVPNRDPDTVRHAGIYALSRDDGEVAIACGWALLRDVGMGGDSTADLLRDGYTSWRKAIHFDRDLAVQFLGLLIDKLESNPRVPGNIWDLPPEIVMPVAEHYGVRTWAASELLQTLPDAERRRWEPEAFRLISSAYQEFVPGRSESWARDYAVAHGLPTPWAR